MSNIEVHDNYLNDRIPAEIAENLKEFFPEHDDLNYEEFLQHQESVYQSLQENCRNRGSTSDYGHSSDSSLISGKEGESSQGGNAKSQLDLDEALARALQELGEDFDDFCISEHSGTAAGSTELSPTETPVSATNQAVRQDDIDPDNMTYEELQSLGETVGTESKGLSDELISRLTTFKYKAGIFSKKKKEECVICYMTYNSGEWVKALPCTHQYHSECITRWLKLRKTTAPARATTTTTTTKRLLLLLDRAAATTRLLHLLDQATTQALEQGGDHQQCPVCLEEVQLD